MVMTMITDISNYKSPVSAISIITYFQYTVELITIYLFKI